MNLKEIKEILALMNENGLTEIEIEREGLKLKLRKAALESQIVAPPAHYAVESLPSPKIVAPASSGPAATPAQSNHKEIKSPMVGTFYRSPSPEAAPFVEIGQIVEIGQVVCIVEAMKLMNEIDSEYDGEITSVYVENGQAVQYGERLFAIKPSN